MRPLNNPALGDFRAGRRGASGRRSGGRSQANPARMRGIRPAHRGGTAETSISRIRIKPTAGNRASKAAASRFRLIAAAAGQDWIFMFPIRIPRNFAVASFRPVE